MKQSTSHTHHRMAMHLCDTGDIEGALLHELIALRKARGHEPTATILCESARELAEEWLDKTRMVRGEKETCR